jgi:hypothetical protein
LVWDSGFANRGAARLYRSLEGRPFVSGTSEWNGPYESKRGVSLQTEKRDA